MDKIQHPCHSTQEWASPRKSLHKELQDNIWRPTSLLHGLMSICEFIIRKKKEQYGNLTRRKMPKNWCPYKVCKGHMDGSEGNWKNLPFVMNVCSTHFVKLINRFSFSPVFCLFTCFLQCTKVSWPKDDGFMEYTMTMILYLYIQEQQKIEFANCMTKCDIIGKQMILSLSVNSECSVHWSRVHTLQCIRNFNVLFCSMCSWK